MDISRAIEIIELHNEWRIQGDMFEGVPFDELTEALNVAVKELKKIKPKKIKQSPEEINQKLVLFSSWWSLYDKKVGREVVQKKWVNLSLQEIYKCLDVVKDYVESKPDKTFRKDPATYLNQKSWNDEIIKPNTVTNAKSIGEIGDGVVSRITAKYSKSNDDIPNESATIDSDHEVVE